MLYCRHKNMYFTCHQRRPNEWYLRLCAASESRFLLIEPREVLTLTTKSGSVREILESESFQPKIRYGQYTTTGLLRVARVS